MKVNIHDVAEKAGVSISTVSRVINNNYPVKKETREKIEQAIDELNYTPNEVARSLILNRTSNIGVIVPGITNPFFPTIGEEIISVLKKEGFIISLFSTQGKSENEKEIIENIMSRNIDGVIAIDPSTKNIKNGYFESIGKKIPLIVVNGYEKDYNFNFVSYDEEIATEEAFTYLDSLNHKKILFVRGDKSLSYDIKEKIYLDFLRKKNIDFSEIINVGKGNSPEVINSSEEILTERLRKKDITAIFACNDLMALGALKSAKNNDLVVPRDLSIIGFDNTLLSKHVSPRLTTVELGTEMIGRIAAEKLLEIIDNKNKTDKYVKEICETRLIIRESCAVAIR